MLSIRLDQRFFVSVISPDNDTTVITKSLFVLMLDSEEGYFLTINGVGRSCPHTIVSDIFTALGFYVL